MSEKNSLPQVFIDIAADELSERVSAYHEKGWHFANLNASTLPDSIEMIYSFTDGLPTENLRFCMQIDEVLPSITGLYPAAFVFENETHDLFGVRFSDISIDFKGRFYDLSVPTPMNPQAREVSDNG